MITIRMLCSMLQTWMQLSQTDRIVVLYRDASKTFVQSLQIKPLLVCQPPEEFFGAYSQFSDHFWRALIQIYGENEAELYWFKTLVPWLIGNFHDLQRYLYDPAFLFSPTRIIAILLCTDDMPIALSESPLTTESAIEKRFTCRVLKFLGVEFKGLDILHDGQDILLSQM